MSSIILAKQTIEDYLLNAPKKLMFRERIWCIWRSDSVVFDNNCYDISGLFTAAEKAKERMEGIFSDMAVEYYSNGERRLVAQPFAMFLNEDYVYWCKKGKYDGDAFFVDEYQARDLFPEQVEYLDRLAKKYSRTKLRFWVSKDTETFRLAMYVRDAMVASFNRNTFEKVKNFSSLGNLQSVFRALGLCVNPGVVYNLEKNRGTNTLFHSYGDKQKSVSFSVGYSAIPYNVAITAIKDEDRKSLRKSYCDGNLLFDISLGGKFLGVSTFNAFDKDLGMTTGLVTLPVGVFQKWGVAFTPDELQYIQRDRKFPYVKYGQQIT